MSDELEKIESTEPDFKWTKPKEEAAYLLAIDELTIEKIAEKVGVGASTVSFWKTHTQFMDRVDVNLAEIRKQVRRRGIAVVENRIHALQDRWGRMQRVIAERGASEEMQAVPGGKTGLLVHNVKAIGGGESAERIDLYEVDTGLLKELREHEKQAAQELGQWTEKQEMSGTVGVAVGPSDIPEWFRKQAAESNAVDG